MRRYYLIILFVLVLVTPFVLRLVMGSSNTAAPAGNAKPLIIITSHVESVRREFADAFRTWHRLHYDGQDVNVDYITLGTGDMVNLFKDRAEVLYPKLKTYQIDIAWGGGDHTFDFDLKPYLEDGVYLKRAVLAEAFPKPTLNGLALYDSKNNPPHWWGAALSSFGITYNRPVLKYLKLPDPKTWNDLSNGAYAGWLILADPGPSSSAKQAFLAIVEKAMADSSARGESEDFGWQKGMGQVRLICSNARTFANGSSTVPGIIASGDAAAGMTIDYYGRSEVEAVGADRLGYVQPAGATVVNPDPIAMVKGAENREIAQRFIEFVLSRQGQLLWNTRVGAPGGPKSTNLRRLPIMPSVYSDMSNFTDKDDPYKSSGGFNKSDAREKTFNIIGELIECSCINCLPELQETRKKILTSPHAAELDTELGLFPFDQKEALRRSYEYKKATPVDQLALKRAWTEEFKTEYEKLRAEADLK